MQIPSDGKGGRGQFPVRQPRLDHIEENHANFRRKTKVRRTSFETLSVTHAIQIEKTHQSEKKTQRTVGYKYHSWARPTRRNGFN